MEKQEKIKVLWWANAPYCPCFDVETEVLTKAGWRYFKDLSHEDWVATLNPATEEIEYYRPEAIINEPYSGPMYRHESKHLSIMCTPNHKLYVRPRGKKGFELVEAAEIYGKWNVEHYCGGASWRGKHKEKHLIPPVEDYHNSVKHIGEVDTNLFTSWFGWYLSEGSYSRGTKREYIVSLAVNKQEANHVLNICKTTFSTLSWFTSEGKSKVNIRTYSKELYSYVEPLGRSHEKYIPAEVKALAEEHLTPLLTSLVNGDGHTQGTQKLFTTSSTRLRDDIMEIALKLGYATKYIKHGYQGKRVFFKAEKREIIQRHDSWRVSINSEHKTPAPHQKKFTEELKPSPDGRIYCAVVPNHIMIVRRNGKAYFSGNTGYGVGTKGVVWRIKDRFDVRVLCFWGLQGRTLYLNDMIHYPVLFSGYGDDAAKLIIDNWAPDIMITFFDIWVSGMPARTAGQDWLPKLHDKWIPWTPVDHDPSPFGITDQAKKAYHVVAMSEFGQNALQREGVSSTLISLGADTKVFKPTEDKAADVEWVLKHSLPLNNDNKAEWSSEDFVVGVNAAPKDPKRKNFHGMFQAFKIFLEQNPDARKDAKLYLHTWKNYPSGWPLDRLTDEVGKYPVEWPLSRLVDQTGITEYCRWTHPYNLYCGLNEEAMNRQYGAYDVFFNMARREGFGIPIIEAAAAGVPTIGTNFTSMPELIEGHGWLVEPLWLELTNLLSYGAVPDPEQGADFLGEAYNSPAKLKDYGQKSREFSLNYDWDVIAELWVYLLNQISEAAKPQSLEERRII